MQEPPSIVIEYACEAVLAAESVTVTVNGYVPACIGVPLMVPALWLSDSPGGSDPGVTEYVYGDVPPEAETCCW